MGKIRQEPIWQRVRKGILLFSLLLFPLTIYYFSPYIIVMSAAEGVVNGSMLVFGLMFVSALGVGRLWCGWLCPAGALQECAAPVRDRFFSPKWLDWIKWGIWLPWIAIIVWLAAQAGGYRQINPFIYLEGGLTVEQPYWYFIYYIVVAAFLSLALIFGRRGGCHTFCWMAPFMILGRKLRNRLNTPALRLHAETEKCINCQKCTAVCSMSLDVNGMVRAGVMEHSECILCRACVDACPKEAIQFVFSRGKG